MIRTWLGILIDIDQTGSIVCTSSSTSKRASWLPLTAVFVCDGKRAPLFWRVYINSNCSPCIRFRHGRVACFYQHWVMPFRVSNSLQTRVSFIFVVVITSYQYDVCVNISVCNVAFDWCCCQQLHVPEWFDSHHWKHRDNSHWITKHCQYYQ